MSTDVLVSGDGDRRGDDIEDEMICTSLSHLKDRMYTSCMVISNVVDHINSYVVCRTIYFVSAHLIVHMKGASSDTAGRDRLQFVLNRRPILLA